MLSSADFVEKQIVVVSSDTIKKLKLQNENVVVQEWNKIVSKMSCSKIFCFFIVGDCFISTKLVDKLLSYQVNVYYLKRNLKPRFLMWTALEWNYVLRSKQYAQTDQTDIARSLVANKIANQLYLLQSLRSKSPKLLDAITRIRDVHSSLDGIHHTDHLRGLEGYVAKLFFAYYFEPLGWYKRMPRTRHDQINLLLDIWYSFLYNFIEANLNLYGFDVYKWVYHTLFYERKSLVCDLVEPFRCLIDKQIRKSYNLWKINMDEFIFKHHEYHIPLQHRQKYMQLLLEPILAHKLDIFTYIKSYYKTIMADDTVVTPFYLGK